MIELFALALPAADNPLAVQGRPLAYAEVMRSAIAVNGSSFNSHRMLQQYISNAYFMPVDCG